MLVTLGEGGEAAFGTNINYFTEEFGIACNSDAVVRTVYYKYLHPKEVHVSNGVLNREINVAAGKRPAPAQGASAAAIAESSRSNLAFAYPYGERRRCHSAPCSLMSTPSAVRRSPPRTCATDPGASSPRPCASCSRSLPAGASLNVAKPAYPVLSSGHIAYPLNRPLCALWSAAPHGRQPASAPPSGKLCVLGSSYLFHDDWCAAATHLERRPRAAPAALCSGSRRAPVRHCRGGNAQAGQGRERQADRCAAQVADGRRVRRDGPARRRGAGHHRAPPPPRHGGAG